MGKKITDSDVFYSFLQASIANLLEWGCVLHQNSRLFYVHPHKNNFYLNLLTKPTKAIKECHAYLLKCVNMKMDYHLFTGWIIKYHYWLHPVFFSLFNDQVMSGWF
jgi:hypothetical protein